MNDIEIHGGLTFASDGDYPTSVEPGGSWWFGFDCAHCEDTPEHWTLERTAKEREKLADEINRITKLL